MESLPNDHSWNAEWAGPFYQDFAAQQLKAGIFAAYRQMAKEVIATSSPEDAAYLQQALYAELPLGVMVEQSVEDPEVREVWLAKIDLKSGKAVPLTVCNTGLTVSLEGFGFESDQSNFFNTDQAAVLHRQYFQQTMNGIDPT